MIVGELRPGFGASRCIFLTRAYLLTSEEPAVAIVAAQMRRPRISPEEFGVLELRLKKRMAVVLRRDIAKREFAV